MGEGISHRVHRGTVGIVHLDKVKKGLAQRHGGTKFHKERGEGISHRAHRGTVLVIVSSNWN
jgi:hypothetical protein